jgi:hypothetical protein
MLWLFVFIPQNLKAQTTMINPVKVRSSEYSLFRGGNFPVPRSSLHSKAMKALEKLTTTPPKK